MRSASAKASTWATTASVPFMAAGSSEAAWPASVAPRRMALAASRPWRMPPEAMSGMSGQAARTSARQTGVGMPQSRKISPRFWPSGAARRGALDGGPAGAARTRDVDGGNAAGDEAAGHLARDAAADFLGDDRNGQGARPGRRWPPRRPPSCGRRPAARPPARGLRWRISASRLKLVHGAARLLQPHAVDELDGAEIAVDRDRRARCGGARARGPNCPGGQRNALRADAHGEAQLLRRLRRWRG